MTTARQTARRVERSDWVERAGRLGLIAKGVSFALVAGLALQVALEGGGHTEDRQGALRRVAQDPAGRWSLILLALGFAGYAAWRFVEGFLDRDREGDGARALAKRGGQVAKGALYTGLCATTISIIVDAHGSDASGEDKWTARVLDLPLGRWAIAAVGVGIVGAGAFNAYRSLTATFRKDLETHKMDRIEKPAYTAVGVAGHAARGVVFALIGAFLIRAAWQYDAKETVGLDGALAKVAQQEYGRWWLGLVAAGLFAYALFCFVQARYRDV